ncbi:hypothetical protein F511_43779 [Dorcoceras hygrometricum]|uniref:Uncharacterized protein n=1 Tax=Dorcoceras hygrometricum TaxID=472368 RepID=A0A2Z7CMW6_9LAMI|nr:hypothetical protein F511_43779 [Dorcoceras hygrometricum]
MSTMARNTATNAVQFLPNYSTPLGNPPTTAANAGISTTYATRSASDFFAGTVAESRGLSDAKRCTAFDSPNLHQTHTARSALPSPGAPPSPHRRTERQQISTVQHRLHRLVAYRDRHPHIYHIPQPLHRAAHGKPP